MTSWLAMWTGVVALFVAGLAGIFVEPGRKPQKPRDLPSLLQEWSWSGEVGQATLVDGVVYIRGRGRLTAVRAEDGSLLWESICAVGEYPMGEGPVVVGDVVVVAFDGKLALVDRQDGYIRSTVSLRSIHEIKAPPLLAVAAGADDRVDLVRIDPETGQIVARREVGGIVYDLQLVGNVAVAVIGRSLQDDTRDELLAGFRTDDLGELWTKPFDGSPDMEWIDGSLHAAVLEKSCDDCDVKECFRRIEPSSGELGPALPERLENELSGGLTWELEVTHLKGPKSPARVRRNALGSGQPIWSVDLPGNPNAWVRVGDSLYLHCDHEGGRGTLVVIDWVSGVVTRSAYGLRGVRGLFSLGDSLVAWMEGGVTRFSATTFGAPERQARDARAEVLRILREVKEGDFPLERREQIQAAVTDIQALGASVLPVVVREVPTLPPVALVAAARVLGSAAHRSAAAPLAARLQEPPLPPKSDWEDVWDPAFDVLLALSQIGGEGEVESVAAVMNDDLRDGVTRRQAFATLASIGTPKAAGIIEAFLSRPQAPRSWFQPPSPGAFADYIGRSDLRQMADSARERRDWDQLRRVQRAEGSARLQLPDGGELLVFHDRSLGGGRDLWVAAMPSAADSGSVIDLLGGVTGGRIRARADRSSLVVESDGSPSEALTVEVSELGRDSDGDGLTDRVERRLRTDPLNADSDGDHAGDALDAVPGGSRAPQTEEDEIVEAIFQQYFLFTEARNGVPMLGIVVNERALEWKGRRGATLTLTPAEDKEFQDEAGLDGIDHIFIRPGRQRMGQDGEDDDEGAATPSPDERAYQLTIYRGGLNAVGYDITVRRLGRLWAITECRFAWIS